MLTSFILVVAMQKQTAPTNLHSFTMPDIDGKKRKLSAYKGKVVLLVNVASKCGYTPQYEGLQALYKKYQAKGFVILGFPCNDFRGQEPGSEKDIKEFCSSKYHVTFPLFSKVTVKGDKKAPIYNWLISSTGGDDIEWNFAKFLIDQKGQIVERWKPDVKPDSSEVSIAVEKLLTKK